MKCLRRSFIAMAWLLMGATELAQCDVQAEAGAARITVLYDAFGKTPNMTKDWGFSAFFVPLVVQVPAQG